jgi:hypothetical protein
MVETAVVTTGAGLGDGVGATLGGAIYNTQKEVL